MPDYQELYRMLFRATETTIEVRIRAQQACEEKYFQETEQDDGAVK